MQATLGKIIALAIAIGWVVASFALEGWTFALTVVGGVLLPLALIWFPKFFGGLTGWGIRARIDRPSPPSLVALMGWFFLLGLPAIVFLLGRK